ncbi:MAG: 1,4-alpha-glucan branching protein [Lentisphaerae bacterium RIFOXYC12_FULL_60_16]|nr:MAG: 1,4-alpha-glucan branching protein [Lentisphaerae bacterium RIFOXYC12_FULL_60_16]OGV75772.1 MAG: 1,4-alpha-glucan branching protein [Lentisphaerae bacterium RIFOXYB12_FULL_60_10]
MPASSRQPAARQRVLRREPFGTDPYLDHFRTVIKQRRERVAAMEQRLTGGAMSLADFASGHTYFGLHRQGDGWVLRERAPYATALFLVGRWNDWWETPDCAFQRVDDAGTWELQVPPGMLNHGDRYRLRARWPGGGGDRVPSHARYVVQDPETHAFYAQVWDPPEPYRWKRPAWRRRPGAPLVYETHVGMAQEKQGVGSYREFTENILPRIAHAGYDTIQLMAVMEHPYYASFGYQVANGFAPSSRFGTPDDFKQLVDMAHAFGLAVVIDLIHSHAVRNEIEGLSRFDGSETLYFHAGPRGLHPAWDSRCFNYGKTETLHLLLSNCRFWLDEFHVDGFRFDGITSMLYHDHGLGRPFDRYDRYFDAGVDEDALAYLTLANTLIHRLRPDALTVAEDVSGMPGLAAPVAEGGCGFDYRLAMGIPDLWFKLLKDVPDEAWPVGHIWTELNNRRADERTISYVECHDQSIVGSKTAAFELMDAAMYRHMQADDPDLTIDRGMALHKLIRLLTLFTAGHGYLNFMGNEFGHPEWVDFPRAGNGWSYHYARRQWSLRDNPGLKYRFLAEFDRAIMTLAREHDRLDIAAPRLLGIHEADKFLAFERGGLVVLVNLHPSQSVADYAVDVDPGRYQWVMDSDEARFGGQGRIRAGQDYFSRPREGQGSGGRCGLQVYVPSRCALVLRRLDQPDGDKPARRQRTA